MTERLAEFFTTIGERLSLADMVDILLVAGGVFVLLRLIEGRRASQMALGTVILGLALVVVGSDRFGLTTIQWVVRHTVPYLGIAIIVLYQADIRNGLAKLGGRGYFRRRRARDHDPDADTIETLGQAAATLSRNRVGAIVVWQGRIGLKSYVDTGRALDAALSAELLVALFQSESPLHDGAAVVSEGRIVAARCLLPLSQRESEGGPTGTRHRAALGLTEETDATVLVVSEETGHVSVVADGRFSSAADRADLEAALASARASAAQAESGRRVVDRTRPMVAETSR